MAATNRREDEVSEATATLPPFHLAIPVDDIDAARRFYGDALGLTEGRSDAKWVDWNLYGHQLVTHQVESHAGTAGPIAGTNPVDGHDVPVPHFGVVLTVADFHQLVDRLRAAATAFVIEPYVRFAGEPGEQWTMFFKDPAGNALEFKAFAHLDQLFAK
jgi:extradiol dioxygenase family protein